MSSARIATRAKWASLALLASIALTSPLASAQGSARETAAAAYDQGVRALASRDFNAAAEFFETANRSVASAQAVIQAIRAHRGAARPAHDARAATLALELLSAYPRDQRVTSFAYRVLDELSQRLARLQVRCQGCDLSVDEQTTPHSAFVTPGSHAIVASWGERVVRRQLSVEAGQTTPLEFSPPLTPLPVEVPPTTATPLPAVTPAAPEAPTAVATRTTSSTGAPETPPPHREIDVPPRRGLSPAVFVVSLVATVGLGGALAWSAIDTLQGRDEYVRDPTQARLDDGRGRELRTNIFIGATAAAAVTTVLVAGLTRWRSGAPRPVATLTPSAGFLGIEGAF